MYKRFLVFSFTTQKTNMQRIGFVAIPVNTQTFILKSKKLLCRIKDNVLINLPEH